MKTKFIYRERTEVIADRLEQRINVRRSTAAKLPRHAPQMTVQRRNQPQPTQPTKQSKRTVRQLLAQARKATLIPYKTTARMLLRRWLVLGLIDDVTVDLFKPGPGDEEHLRWAADGFVRGLAEDIPLDEYEIDGIVDEIIKWVMPLCREETAYRDEIEFELERQGGSY